MQKIATAVGPMPSKRAQLAQLLSITWAGFEVAAQMDIAAQIHAVDVSEALDNMLKVNK